MKKKKKKTEVSIAKKKKIMKGKEIDDSCKNLLIKA